MAARKRIRIIKKVRETAGEWRFVSLSRIGDRYVWDQRPGYYFVEWWEGRKRRRQLAGQTPSEAMEAQRRKRNELLGERLEQGKAAPAPVENGSATPLADAKTMFVEHVRAHSPGKPRTVQRYQQVVEHFSRLLGHKKYIEAITRADIDDYKIKRSEEFSRQHPRRITPRTINFEVSTLRTFFVTVQASFGEGIMGLPLKTCSRASSTRPPCFFTVEI